MNFVALDNMQKNCQAIGTFFAQQLGSHPIQKVDELLEMIGGLATTVKQKAEGLTYDSVLQKTEEFRSWVNEREGTQLKDHLEVFLVKIPLKSALNLLDMMKAVVLMAGEIASDPAKGSEKLFNLLQEFLMELITPETWPSLSMGLIGAHFAEVAILGAPLSIYALIVVAAIGIAGIGLDLLITDFEAKTESLAQVISEKLKGYAYRLPEAFFTGFFFSSLFGAFRRAYYGVPQRPDFFIQRNLTCGPRPTCIDFPLELIMQPEHRVLNGFSAISALGAAKSQSA